MLSEVTKLARKTLQDRESDRKIRFELTKALQVLADTGITISCQCLGWPRWGSSFPESNGSCTLTCGQGLQNYCGKNRAHLPPVRSCAVPFFTGTTAGLGDQGLPAAVLTHTGAGRQRVWPSRNHGRNCHGCSTYQKDLPYALHSCKCRGRQTRQSCSTCPQPKPPSQRGAFPHSGCNW